MKKISLLIGTPFVILLSVAFIVYRAEGPVTHGVTSPRNNHMAKENLGWPALNLPLLSEHKDINSTATAYINPGCVTRKLNKYRTSKSTTVYYHPPIVHYVKLFSGNGDVQLKFRDYLAMMSAYKFLRPEKILVHSNVNVYGKYFDLSQQWNGTAVIVNKVERKTILNGKRVAFIQHAADYVKVSQVLKYGGLVSDFDVIIINGTRLKEEQRRSECIIAEEGEIPNLGLVSCIKNSSFVRRWWDQYNNKYDPKSWLYNAAYVPFDILTKDTSVCYNVHLEDTMCTHPNAYESKTQWLSRNGVPHWRTKTAAHYYLQSSRLPSEDKLLNSDTSMSEMMRYVNDYKLSG